MPTLGAQKWAIVLCQFSGVTGTPVTVDFCKKFFLARGTGGLNDYWNDVSYEKFSLDRSVVLGPFTLSYTLNEAQASATRQSVASHTDPSKRTHPRLFRAQDAIDDLVSQIDYSDIHGVVLIFNAEFDLGAASANLPLSDRRSRGVPVVLFGPLSFTQDLFGHLAAHESAHMLGVAHSRRLGAQEEYAARGDTSAKWAYTDGWCISGGIRDDGSGNDCRFQIANVELLMTRSGPGLKAKSVRDLGWMEASRVHTYGADSQDETWIAALNHPEGSGALMVQSTPTYAGSARYCFELRWKDGWDAGIPRHAFLIHKIDEADVTHLVPRSPTQHDWVPGDRFTSIADGIGIDFEEIDTGTRRGRVRLKRVVGQAADELVGGGWGMLALQRGTGLPFRYLDRPGQWTRVGDPAAQFAISSDALFGLSADREKIWKYTGRERSWVQVGESADAILAGGWGMIALQRGTGIPFRYLGQPGRWVKVGGPAAQFAISGDALFGLASDRKKVWRYTGREELWEQVGESADALVAGAWGMVALQRGTGIPFRFLGRAGAWLQVGGAAAQFVISNNGLYGLATDRKKVWRYTGRERLWQQVGGAAHSIAAGGSTLFSLSSDRDSIARC